VQVYKKVAVGVAILSIVGAVGIKNSGNIDSSGKEIDRKSLTGSIIFDNTKIKDEQVEGNEEYGILYANTYLSKRIDNEVIFDVDTDKDTKSVVSTLSDSVALDIALESVDNNTENQIFGNEDTENVLSEDIEDVENNVKGNEDIENALSESTENNFEGNEDIENALSESTVNNAEDIEGTENNAEDTENVLSESTETIVTNTSNTVTVYQIEIESDDSVIEDELVSTDEETWSDDSVDEEIESDDFVIEDELISTNEELFTVTYDEDVENSIEAVDENSTNEDTVSINNVNNNNFYIEYIALSKGTYTMSYDEQYYLYCVCCDLGIDYDIAMGVIALESSFDNNASSDSAYGGYFQVDSGSVEYARSYWNNYNLTISNPYDSILIGVTTLRYHLDMTGDIYNALISYAWGNYNWQNGNYTTNTADIVMGYAEEIRKLH